MLDNKLDDLHARISFQWDIRNCNVLCFTKTWLNPEILDSAIQPGEVHCVPGHKQQPAGCDVLGDDAASSSCWCWRSRRSMAATSSSSPLSSGFSGSHKQAVNFAYWLELNRHQHCLTWEDYAMLHPLGHRHDHHEQGLPGVHFLQAVVRIHQASSSGKA